jgi:ABC-2 type transport system permease protein
MNWMRVFRYGLFLGFQDFKTFWKNWRVWVMTHLLRVATSAIMWVLLGRVTGSEEGVYFLLVGQIVIAGPQYVGWTVAAFTWDRMFIGTYPMLVAAPCSLVPAMVGRTSIWLLNGIATSLITLAVLAPLFDLPLSLSAIVWLPVLIVVVCVSFYGLAFCLGSLVNWVPQLRNIVHNTTSLLITTFCGVVVPVAFWPNWVERLAQILPVTHGLEAIRLLIRDAPAREIAWGTGLEIFVGLAWFAVGILTLDRTVNLARRRGTIDLV